MTLEHIANLAQSCFSNHPVLVIGSGASAQYGLPGMDALRDAFFADIAPEGDQEGTAWQILVDHLNQGEHLELAMSQVNLPNSLLNKVLLSTWNCVNSADRLLAKRTLANTVQFELCTLFSNLLNTTQHVVNVVTTNYDRVVEFACNSGQFFYQTGFTSGYIQSREEVETVTLYHGRTRVKAVRIWKVHGSLDWFMSSDGRALAAPLFEFAGDGFLPLIVTPGIAKYQATHDEPYRSTITGADASLKGASSFLCIGYGFRDSHIHPKITESCRSRNTPIVVITRTLTQEAKVFMATCAGSRYLAMERCKDINGTRAYTRTYPDGIDFPNEDYWSLAGFLKLVLP